MTNKTACTFLLLIMMAMASQGKADIFLAGATVHDGTGGAAIENAQPWEEMRPPI